MDQSRFTPGELALLHHLDESAKAREWVSLTELETRLLLRMIRRLAGDKP